MKRSRRSFGGSISTRHGSGFGYYVELTLRKSGRNVRRRRWPHA